MERNEGILRDFLTEKIDKSGGSSQIKYLCQLLPSLSYDVRSSVANNQAELMRFLRKHSEIFQVDANGNVRLQSNNLTQVDDDRSGSQYEKSEPDDDLPKKLTNGEGVVIKIHPTFGFIAAKQPFKTTVYFSPNSFGDDQITILTDIEKLYVGAKVGFHANKGNNERSSKYRAYRVWMIQSDKEGKAKVQNDCEPKSRKTRETGKYDAVINEGEGRIQKLLPNYGFILIDNDKNNTVFFYKNQVAKYENVTDLNKVMKKGDLVEFKAVRTAGKNIQARWSATQVWLKKSAKTNQNSIETSNLGKGGSRKQYLKNQSGKIYPHSQGIVIKFGSSFEHIADADSSVFYMLGAKVSDVSWEFSDGDNVHFDAAEIKSHPGWKATLVWTGKRPDVVLPPDLGDFSEFADDIDDSASVISALSENSNRSYQQPLSRSSGYSSLRQSHEDLNFGIPSSRNKYSIGTHSNIDLDVEDVSDATSCYSRSSDKSSGGPGRGPSTNSRAQRRASNFRNKFNNQTASQSNINNSSNSYNENPRSDNNSNAYYEGRESLNKNTYNEREESLNRNSCNERQESLKRNSYNERGESLNWRQDNSSKGAGYRNTYQQGHANRSSKSYQDRRPDDKSSSVGRRSAFNENQRFKRHEEFLKKYLDEDSPIEPDDDNDSESSKHQASVRVTPVPEIETYTNWADTPYPGEDDDLVVNYGRGKEDSDIQKEEKQEDAEDMSRCASLEEVYNSEDEFSDPDQNNEESVPHGDQMEHELLNYEDNKDEKEIPSKCSVKIYKDIEGTIKKVSCKYGQIISPLLPSPASFFWHDVYCKGVAAPDRCDDLREVLNVGDVLKFNCIRVVDDEESNFIKCTLLWKDEKPNILEMTPQEYIDNEELKVNDNYEIEVVTPNDLTTANVPSDQPRKRFLVSVDSGEKDAEASASSSEPLPKSSVCNEIQDSNLSSEDSESEPEIHSDKDEIITGISQIIKHSGLAATSQMDLNSVSSEIFNFVMNMHAIKNLESVSRSAKETQTEIEYVTPPEHVFTRSDGTEMTNTESQTIFTGTVIGNNIFTQC